MARVSIARWNLKEAAGKALARRTETAWEDGSREAPSYPIRVERFFK